MKKEDKKRSFSPFHIAQGYIARKHGRWAEWLSLCLLRIKGYRILAQGYKTPFAEVDLIAARRNILVFCEVKHRLTLENAGESISDAQKKRIVKAAYAFRRQYPRFQNHDIRFDAILVVPRKFPHHVQGAWWEEMTFQ